MAPNLVKFIVLFLLFGLVVSQIPRRNERPRNKSTQAPRKTTEAPIEYDDGSTDQCPEPTGYFADADQCDKYYACIEGHIEEKLCPDGMVFNDYDINVEKCDLPYNIDCTKRSKLQTPRPTQNCPRLNGYFGHEDANVCDTFFYCVDGQANKITCPSGLVFNQKTGICTWADEAGKVGCSSEDIFHFTCKKVNESVAVAHPRYSDPEDCQYFYVCINGETPRRNGCKLGQVFNDKTKNCDWARNVPECADFYKDRLTDKELADLETPSTTEKPQRKSSVPSKRKQNQNRASARREQQRKLAEEEELIE